MKTTWLRRFFGLFFIPANGRAKFVQQLISTVLPFHPLYFLWLQYWGSLSLVAKPHFIIIQRIFKKWHTDKLIMARAPSSHHPNTAHTYPQVSKMVHTAYVLVHMSMYQKGHNIPFLSAKSKWGQIPTVPICSGGPVVQVPRYISM